ncbi:MAG TPA: excalibur calcium-binding domain-containing protein [Solirubrobacterales bacterium]|nr:excalibur calcium-binding domain-containing protein [Solirubrobacterales bacterium]
MRLSLWMGLSASGVLLLAALVLWLPATASARDRDCADFRSQRAAQIFYIKHGGPRRDPHRLDGDDDGVACEDNRCPCYHGTHLPHRASTFLGDRLKIQPS